ncbi:MAG: universal stress protein [Streptosporangiaceae bacterium]|nr:universal stress protein [Streptosporangiaceae bacterium]MBV9853904.1 universal stress protein [Streptosporangiaceae bacterium]
MTVPAVRRIVVGVDGSAESAAALRWACREACLRGAEVHAVHAWEAPCHSVASYAVPAQAPPPSAEAPGPESLRGLVPDDAVGIRIRTEVAEGLAARVLLDRCAGADMLVLGSAGDTPGSLRAAGPVIRACLRRAVCPVVVISAPSGPAMPAHASARASGEGSRSPAGAYV